MKKILSFILATAIILSLIPASLAADTTEIPETNVTLVYDMCKLGVAANASGMLLSEIGYPETSGFWRYHSKSNNSKDVTVKNGVLQITKDNDWVAIGIYVPVAGTYTVQLTYTTYQNNGAIGGMYIFPGNTKNIEAAFADKTAHCVTNSITYIDTSKANTYPTITGEEKYTFTEPGEYIIVYKRESNGEDNGTATNDQRMYPGKITLTQGNGGKVPMAVHEAEINVDATVLITPYDSNARIRIDEANASTGLTYTSSDKDIAKVSADGTVTGVAGGTAVITATGDAYAAPLEVTIKVNDPKLPTIKYDVSGIIKASASGASSSAFTEAVTNGFFRYISGQGTTTKFSSKPNYIKLWTKNNVVFEVYVPVAGTYTMSINHAISKKLTGASVYVNGSATAAGHYDCYDADVAEDYTNYNDSQIEGITLNKGWNTIKFVADDKADANASIGSFTLSAGTGDALMPYLNGNSTLEIGETATLSGFLSSTATAVDDETYSVEGDAVTVDANGIITAVKPGKATVTMTTATTATAGNTCTVEITVPDKKTDFVSVGIDNDGDGYATITSATLGADVTVTAADRSGYVFRGWVRGSADNGHLVWTEQVYTFTATTHTYLTAIYTEEVEGETNEYYHWNGQFLGNDQTTAEANLSPIVGYTFAGTWTPAKKENLITSYIANFDIQSTDYTVTAGNDGFSISKADSKYDTEVTCTSTSDNAVYWYRDGKLVDYGTEYKFFIWDSTTITTSNEGHNGAKLMLDKKVKENTTYMVEYDAGNATLLEVGILFGATGETPTVDSCKEKMSSQRKINEKGHGQFSATADEYTVARGYLIYKDGDSYRVIYAD